MTSQLRARTVTANGLRFGVLEAGRGPLALCLHGFPDSAHTWRYLLPALADAGFHAVAPFMRGYAPTGIPADGCFRLGAPVADVVGLHDALDGDNRAVLIGHDWGAETAYGAAAFAPDRWRRVVTLAVPPLAVKECLRGEGHLGAAIGYYRAEEPGLHHFGADGRYAAQEAALANAGPQPTLYLHGNRDGCIDPALVEDAERYLATGSKMEVVEGAGHFLQVEKPAVVNDRILAWVSA